MDRTVELTNRHKYRNRIRMPWHALISMFKRDPMIKSRVFFILEGITGMGQFSLTTGAFLAGFVSFLDGSESLNGMLGVVPSAAGVLQIFSVLFMSRGKSRKEQSIKIAIIFRLLLASIYFIPYLFITNGAAKSVVLIVFVTCFIVSYGMNALLAPMVSNWLVDVAPIEIRGKYLAKREMISLGIIAATTITLGKVLDIYENLGQEITGFLIVGIVLSIMGVLNIVALKNIEDVKQDETAGSVSFFKQLMVPVKDRIFRKIIGFYMLWNVALFIGGSYISVYNVERLDLSYTYMMSMTVLGTIVRVVCNTFWGRLADKKSWFKTAVYSLIVLSLCHFSWGFVVPANSSVFVPILNFVAGIAWAGVGISIFNMQYLFVKPEARMISIGVNAAIGGLISIAAVKIGGLIVDMDFHGIIFMGDYLSGMQVVFMLSGILLFGCTFYIRKVLEPLNQNG